MAEQTIFDKIVDGTIPSFKVWEDETYLAFLTPFPNTPGTTVVIPKKNPGDYIAGIDPAVAHGLLDAAAKVAKMLEKAFGVKRVGIAFEGTGVPHVHAKLYPFHDESAAPGGYQEFTPAYRGYFSTADGPHMSDEELTAIQHKITEAAK
jgi:diadenosine tetraphosphate (Ap4A) HIT family hydrolase